MSDIDRLFGVLSDIENGIDRTNITLQAILSYLEYKRNADAKVALYPSSMSIDINKEKPKVIEVDFNKGQDK